MLLQIPSSHYQQRASNANQEDDLIPNDDDDDVSKASHGPIETNHPDQNISGSTNANVETTPFLKVLQDLHAVAGTIATTTTSTTTTSTTTATSSSTNGSVTTTTTIPIPKKCPVFHATTTTTNHPAFSTTTSTSTTVSSTSSKFTHVIMDGYSLSEIMARLAKEIEEEEEQARNVDSSEAAVTSSTIETPRTALEDTMKTQGLADGATTTAESEETHPEIAVLLESSSKNVAATSIGTTNSAEADGRKLSVTMKSGTAASHVAAENVHFVRNFIRGQIDPTLFAALTKQLFYVYRTLEYHLLESSSSTTGDDTNRVHLQQFQKFHQALQRTESLKEDLDYWFGTKEAQQMIHYELSDDVDNDSTNPKFISPATRDYIQRIQYCAQQHPYLLLAHSYTRYLGDLSGGKILARVARKALQLSSTDDGLAFYDFHTTISNTKQFKDEYRLALDQLDPPLTTEQIQLLVAEANIAFVLNMRIFEELDVMANIPNATVRQYEEAIRPYVITPGGGDDGPSHITEISMSSKTEIPKECPFANMNATSSSSTTTHHTKASNSPAPHHAASRRCPWPFVLFHDPQQFLLDWQTWMTFGLVLCWLYHQLVVATSNSAVES